LASSIDLAACLDDVIKLSLDWMTTTHLGLYLVQLSFYQGKFVDFAQGIDPTMSRCGRASKSNNYL
jgi:hypothetical protein